MDRRKSTSPSHRHLAPETVMRIEVSLSSRRSSVVVFNTTARLVALGRGEWSSVAYGAPCILLLRETTAQDSPFQVKFVIAELESGIAVWEEELTPESEYTELQPGFHSFKVNEQTMAVQFADPSESASFNDSLVQYLSQKERVDQLLEEKKNKSPSSRKLERKLSKKMKKKRGFDDSTATAAGRRINKIDISLPCEFRHLSGITAGHTEVCQKELEGKIERHQRSASMGAISQKQVKQRGRIPDDMNDGTLYQTTTEKSKEVVDGQDPKQEIIRGGSNRGKFSFRSLRLMKKRLSHDTELMMNRNKDDSSVDSPRITMLPSSSSFSKEETSDTARETTPTASSFVSPAPGLPLENDSTTAIVASSRDTSPSNVTRGWQDNVPISPSKHLLSPKRAEDLIQTQQLHMSPPAVVNEPDKTQFIPLITRSPQRLPLQPLSPQQQQQHLYNKKPSIPNTYDMLEPLHADSKPTKQLNQLSPPGKHGAPDLISKMTPLHAKPRSPTKATNEVIDEPGGISLISPLSADSPAAHQIMSTSVSAGNQGRSSASPQDRESTPSDLDHLTQELSKVLKDFDDLVAPRSPFLSERPPFSFHQPHSVGKETMV